MLDGRGGRLRRGRRAQHQQQHVRAPPRHGRRMQERSVAGNEEDAILLPLLRGAFRALWFDSGLLLPALVLLFSFLFFSFLLLVLLVLVLLDLLFLFLFLFLFFFLFFPFLLLFLLLSPPRLLHHLLPLVLLLLLLLLLLFLLASSLFSSGSTTMAEPTTLLDEANRALIDAVALLPVRMVLFFFK